MWLMDQVYIKLGLTLSLVTYLSLVIQLKEIDFCCLRLMQLVKFAQIRLHLAFGAFWAVSSPYFPPSHPLVCQCFERKKDGISLNRFSITSFSQFFLIKFRTNTYIQFIRGEVYNNFILCNYHLRYFGGFLGKIQMG